MKFSVSNVFSKVAAIVAVTLGCAMHVNAQEVIRPVTSAYTVEFGTAHLSDTYLTPLKYGGWHVGASYERFQAMRFCPDDWIMRLRFDIGVDRTRNTARNATLWNLDVSAGWAMMRRWRLPVSFTLAAGGSTTLEGGVLYLSRNGNNPVSAKAAWTLNLAGLATWQTRLGRVPVTIGWQPELPVIGAFFSPDYGELYYEIYLGNHSNLAHAAWWGNRFVLDNLVTADLRFGATSLRLGYKGHILTSKVNNIVTREFTHAFVIGVSGEWMSLAPNRKPSDEARIISAYY